MNGVEKWIIVTVKFLYTHCKESLHFTKIGFCNLLVFNVLQIWHADCYAICKFVKL